MMLGCNHMKAQRIREKIKKYLESGSKNTIEILDMVNNYYTHGTSYQQLGKILNSEENIAKVGRVKCRGNVSGYYKIFEWALR